jgi:hypothetical protein
MSNPHQNQTNLHIIAFTYMIQITNIDLYNQALALLNQDQLIYLINITNININDNPELLRIINIFRDAFNYILIKDIINNALNNIQQGIDQLRNINVDLLNIIQSINNNNISNILLTHVLENMQ